PHQPRKGCKVEEIRAQEPIIRQREAQFIATNALGLHFKTRRAGKVADGEPELAGFSLAWVHLGGNIIVDHDGTTIFHGGSLRCGVAIIVTFYFSSVSPCLRGEKVLFLAADVYHSCDVLTRS